MTRVALTIDLPARRIQCEGTVVRSESVAESGASPAHFRLAIFFTRLAARDRQAIARFVAEQLAGQRPAQPSHEATSGAPPAPHRRRLPCLLGPVIAAFALGGFLGCKTPFAVSRGRQTRELVDELGRTAQQGQSYTFRWLRRRFADFYSHQRFDGLVVDLHGRSIEVLRQQDGDHVLRLQAPTAGTTAQPSRHAATDELKITPKDLPTLQAVVRRYHFEPQLITNAVGEPQLVIYAPVPTHVSVIHLAEREGLCVEVRRVVGQPTRSLSASSFGDASGSGF